MAFAIIGNLVNSLVILLTIVSAMALGIGLGYASIKGIFLALAGPKAARKPATVIAFPADVRP